MTLGYHRLFLYRNIRNIQTEAILSEEMYCCICDIGQGTPLNILTENLQGTKTKISWFQEIL